MLLKNFQEKILYGNLQSDRTNYLKHHGLISYVNEIMSGSSKKEIYIQSPTGSGKTRILAELLKDKREYATIWLSIADGDLHLQSKKKIENYNGYKCYEYKDISSKFNLVKGDIVFISLNALRNKKSHINNDSSTSLSFENIINNTNGNNIPILLIIDESHKGLDTEIGLNIFDYIKPKIKIEVSATNTSKKIVSDNSLIINSTEVIDEGLIKKEIIINQIYSQNEKTPLTSKNASEIINSAINQQKIIQAEYNKNPDLNNLVPLILIQIANKSDFDINNSSKDIIRIIKECDPSISDYDIAVWLSEDKSNNTDIINGKQRFLIFKQAIATGWDCPRAHILVKLREFSSNSESFDIQLLGRVLRTINGKHYNNQIIDVAYLYTDSEEVNTVIDFEHLNYGNFISEIKTNIDSFTLVGQYLDNNKNTGLSAEQIKAICELLKNDETINSLLKNSRFNPILETKIPIGQINSEDINSEYIFGVVEKESTKVSSTRNDLYNKFISILKNFFNSAYKPHLKESILESVYFLYKSIFNLNQINEQDEIYIYNSFITEDKSFIDVLNDIKQKLDLQLSSTKEVNKYIFNLPLKEFFNKKTHKLSSSFKKNVFHNYYLQNTKSNIEKKFENYIDNNPDVLFWYKNGITPKLNYSITYNDASQVSHNFFPDYIIKLKCGKYLVMDTKSGNTLIDAIENNKLRALYDFGCTQKNYSGRIIIFNNNEYLVNKDSNVNIDRVKRNDFSDFIKLSELISNQNLSASLISN